MPLAVPPAATDASDKSRSLALLKKQGRNSFSSCLLYDDVKHYWCERISGFVGYLETPALLVAIGEPVCDSTDYRAAADEFIEFAARRGCSVVFIAVGDQFAGTMGDRRPTLLVIGEDLIFDVQTYAPRGDRAKKVRSAANQLARRRCHVKEYCPSILRDERIEDGFARVATSWLRTRQQFQMHFLSLDMFCHADLKRYFYLEVDERLVACLCCLPIYARRGYLFEDMAREPDAPRGTSETLVLGALRAFRAEVVLMATFGLSPRPRVGGASNLSWFGRGLVGAAMNAATRLSRLDRLYHSRKKYNTEIAEPSYLLKYPPGIRAREVVGVLRAFNLG